jgi:spoIIIJ-associated protein
MQNAESAEKSAASGADERLKALEAESDIAADYLEELLDIADLDGDIDMDIDGDRAAVSIVGADLSNLVGENGKVLEALQELTRLAVYRETGERSRLMLDVSNYRANRKAELEKVGKQAVEDAQGRARRRRRGGSDQRVRGRGAAPPGRRPAGLTSCSARDR